MSDFTVYALGIVSASVCTTLPAEEVADRMNIEEPTGIDSEWALSEDATFKGGQPNPCPCDQLPATHMHYLMVC